jgi:hypothetical protein
MSRYRELLAELSERWPPSGPCAICGGPDKRHRLWDAVDMSGRLDGVRFAAKDYSMSGGDVRLVMRAYEMARREHRRLPGQYPIGEGR